ncbi:hypothetical protein [Planotetraspora kaengkrachanensis]|uniref:Uncharacterized protein n=1 Tax=Planotetraspora kaengkrachanensis TaxID=575193 RepID=A0A8J3M225_9ACTN|nr:hypothetical protein [Planotetraspora kaengkrachanensis]GIG77586.1 hypothetical protein Pka01_07130 [Planotetraspora kaengkrachanensis]
MLTLYRTALARRRAELTGLTEEIAWLSRGLTTVPEPWWCDDEAGGGGHRPSRPGKTG